MTAPADPREALAAIRDRHRLQTAQERANWGPATWGENQCMSDGKPWPCDAAVLLEALAARQDEPSPALRDLILEGIEAFRLTREYVGEAMLPPIEGWSWFDWTEKAKAALAARQDEPSPVLRADERLDFPDELLDADHEIADFLHDYLWGVQTPHVTEPQDGDDCNECYAQAERLRDLIWDAVHTTVINGNERRALAANPPQTREADLAWDDEFDRLTNPPQTHEGEGARETLDRLVLSGKLDGVHAGCVRAIGEAMSRTPEAQRDAEPPISESIANDPETLETPGQRDAGNRGIDPDLLARAIHERRLMVHQTCGHPVDDIAECDNEADWIGREYDRLAATQPPAAGTEGTE